MSILIKDMEMPKNCFECRFNKMNCCIASIPAASVALTYVTRSRKDNCPLVPVPKHGDLIDADKLVELCDIMADKCDGIGASIWHQFKTTVEWSPIVIPAEEGE